MASTLQLTAVHLRVADLARSVAFYVGQLGFVAVKSTAVRAELAVAPDAPALLTLTEDRIARPAPSDAAGLFHAALLLPSRAALGGWLRFAGDHGVEFDGFSDHGVSEAIYFSDPDGNGLEFYADRPRESWPPANSGEVAMFTRPLNLPDLLAHASPTTDTPLAGAQWGHLHLSVSELARSGKFYRDTLGVAVTQGSFPGALFLAADGYHHHLGLNTWGRARAPQPAGAPGLMSATFAHAGTTVPRELRDPDGIAVVVTPLVAVEKT